MKQYTIPEQTTKLIELGFDRPKNRVIKQLLDRSTGSWITVGEEDDYSIGELIEMLEEVASVVISYSYQKNGYYVRAIIPKREGGGMYRISRIELVDALYDMFVKLKEEGVI